MRSHAPRLLALIALALPVAPCLGAPTASVNGTMASPGKDKARAKELLKVIRNQRGVPSAAPFEELGRMRSQAGLDALMAATGLIRHEAGFALLFDGVRDYSVVPKLQEDALDFLATHAESATDPIAAAATPCMLSFGEEGAAALFEVAESGRSAVGRAHAIGCLRKELREAGDSSALEILLGGVRVPQSGPRSKVESLLRSFKSPADFRALSQYVKGKRADEDRALLIVEAVSQHDAKGAQAIDDGVALVLESALRAKSPALQYYALSAASARGVSLKSALVAKLAKSKDASVAKAALVAGMAGPSPVFSPEELATSRDAISRQAATVGLAARYSTGKTAALDVVHQLLADEDSSVRLSALRALEGMRAKDSIPALIHLLASETGRIRVDARAALRSITGRDYGLGAGAWERFWEAEGDSFKVPSSKKVREAERRAKRKKADGSSAEFYGIQIVSDRFALIVDTSGSMLEPAYGAATRMDVAKREISKTLDRLKAGVLFNLISFDAVARPMRSRMAKASKANTKKAHQYVEGLRADGGTNIYDALKAAFEDEDIDTIYLMSDGDPSLGRITEIQALRAEIARWNSARNIVIHCVAIGQDHALLRGLAKDHRGQYVLVN